MSRQWNDPEDTPAEPRGDGGEMGATPLDGGAAEAESIIREHARWGHDCMSACSTCTLVAALRAEREAHAHTSFGLNAVKSALDVRGRVLDQMEKERDAYRDGCTREGEARAAAERELTSNVDTWQNSSMAWQKRADSAERDVRDLQERLREARVVGLVRADETEKAEARAARLEAALRDTRDYLHNIERQNAKEFRAVVKVIDAALAPEPAPPASDSAINSAQTPAPGGGAAVPHVDTCACEVCEALRCPYCDSPNIRLREDNERLRALLYECIDRHTLGAGEQWWRDWERRVKAELDGGRGWRRMARYHVVGCSCGRTIEFRDAVDVANDDALAHARRAGFAAGTEAAARYLEARGDQCGCYARAWADFIRALQPEEVPGG